MPNHALRDSLSSFGMREKEAVMLANNDEYLNVLGRITKEIPESQNRAVQSANAELISLYWRVGCAIDERSLWGNRYLETLSLDIRTAFPGIKGFSVRNMKYMVKFAREVDGQLCNSCCTIPWGHLTHLLDKTNPGTEREWYMRATIENGWSRAILLHQIEIKLYERQVLAGKVSNFERTLPAPESELAQQALKDPYIFDFITARQGAVEHEVENCMMENITKLLLELGTGFAFVGRQYHLAVGSQDFYIDLLFYNIRLRSYVVVELKNAAFKPEFAGKLNFCLSAVDDLLCTEHDNHSIGLLLCKTKDNVIAEYALRDIGKPMGVSEYRLAEVLPEGFADLLPSPEDIEKRM